MTATASDPPPDLSTTAEPPGRQTPTGQTPARQAPAGRPADGPTAWSPLRIKLFRWIWLAGLVSNIGTFMHTVGAAWLMTSLTSSPGQVALLQTAAAVPAFCLALLAGALADIVDRRRLLIGSQVLMLAAAGVLGVLTVNGSVTPAILLGLTLVLGIGATLNLPAWAAMTPELVPRSELAPAVALNAIGINAAAAIGPALGGVVVAALGPAWVFFLNAASFVAMIVAVYGWRREPASAGLPAEHLVSAVRTGVRYVRNAVGVQIVLTRAALFMLFASALTALLPVVARGSLHASAGQFGILSAALGGGAVVAGFALPRIRRVVPADGVIALAAVGYAAATCVVAATTSLAVTCLALLVAGAASIMFISVVIVTMQAILPSWVRGRAIAVYMLVFQGSMAAGAAAWGAVASGTSPRTALLGAAVGLVVATGLSAQLRLTGRADTDPSSARLWPDPVVMIEHGEDDGPVLVQLEWRIDPGDVGAFTAAMRSVSQQRRRDGAMRWGLYQDTAEPGRMVESYTVATWAEHQRQHTRVTAADVPCLAAASAFLPGGGAPRTTHLLAGREGRHQHGAAAAAAAHHTACTVGTTGG